MRRFDVKYGKEEDRRMWLKVHLICGVKTNIVTSVEISDGYPHAYHYCKSLVNNTAENGFKMSEVAADKRISRWRKSSYLFASWPDPAYSLQVELSDPNQLWLIPSR